MMSKYSVTIEIETRSPHSADLSKLDDPFDAHPFQGLTFERLSSQGHGLLAAVAYSMREPLEVVRAGVVDFMKSHKKTYHEYGAKSLSEFEQHLAAIQNHCEMATGIELAVLQAQWGRPIIILRPDGKVTAPDSFQSFSGHPILIGYENNSGCFDGCTLVPEVTEASVLANLEKKYRNRVFEVPVDKIMQEAKKALFLELPNEIWVEIFKHLTSAKDLCRMAQVSRQFYQIANDVSLWKNTDLSLAPLDALDERWNREHYKLYGIFLNAPYGLRFKLLHIPKYAKKLRKPLYHFIYMEDMKGKMTFLFKKLETLKDICDVEVTKTLSSEHINILIQYLTDTKKLVETQNSIAIELIDPRFLKDNKIHEALWVEFFISYSWFLIRHPHLGPRLTRKHLKQLLEVTTLSQSVARTMVETVFLHETQLPALQTPVDESFFKLVAASLTRNDYKHMLWTQDNPSVPIAYVRKRFKEKRLIQNGIIDEQYPLQDLIKLASQDGRIALMLFAVPELTQVVPINTLFDLALNDLNAGEQHWARASFDRWNSDHYLQKCPKDSPIITLYFSYLAWALVFSASTQVRFFNQLHEMHYNKTYAPPDTWKDGFPLALTQFKWAHDKEGLVRFELPLCQPDYKDLHRLWQLFLAHRRTLQLPREPAVNAVIPPSTVSPDEPSMAPLYISTPSGIIDESSRQRVLDNTVSPPSVVFETRTNVLDADINTASHNKSSTSWGTLIAWLLSAVLTTAGVGLLVLSTILSATYMMPLMVGGFISLASGLVLGLKLLAWPKTTYEMRTSVDNYEAVRPTFDTEPRLHQKAILYEALNLSEVSRHAQLPVKHLMQPTQNLSPSTEETSVLSQAV